MWNEPLPTWRKARTEHSCQGEGCAHVILRGEKYLDKALREPANTHLRYCSACGEAVMEQASRYHSLNGRNDFPDRYQQRIASADWKNLKRELISERGNRCERCTRETNSLELHHKHYKSLGQELPDDLELLCADCHKAADEARTHSHRPKYQEPQEGWIVGANGNHRGKLDESEIYIPLDGGRYVPLKARRPK